MFGVILWKDPVENQALIWCEDHGELAYFDGNHPGAGQIEPISAGDLVQFELKIGARRFARKPRRVAENSYPFLAARLTQAAKTTQARQNRKPANIPAGFGPRLRVVNGD